MQDKRTKQVMVVAICVVISVFGLYFTFFGKKNNTSKEDKKITAEELKEKKDKFSTEYDYKNKDLPDTENESDDSYTEGMDIKIYFTNTEKLDKSSLPLSVQRVLYNKTQTYLYSNGYDDVSELIIEEKGFDDNESKVSFLCEMAGYEEKLRISYDKGNEKLKFESVIISEIKN